MRRSLFIAIAVTFGAALLIAPVNTTFAQDAASYYANKAIKWIVPYKPGGGYDEYSRLLAPYMEKYTGARVDIVNLQGSGGMKGATEIFRSPPDGLTIGIVPGSALVMNEIAEREGAAYKVGEFVFLGRIVKEQRALVVGVNSGIEDFDHLMSDGKVVVVGAGDLGGNGYVDAVITGKVLGIDQKVVYGFNNSPDIRLAILRGDLDAWWGSLAAARKGVSSGDFKIILHAERQPPAGLEGVPNVFDVASASGGEAEDIAVLEAWKSLSAIGRPVVAPPGVPEDRADFLQEAFRKAMMDPDFIAQAEGAKRSLSFASSEETVSIVRAVTDLDDDIRALFKAAIKGEL